MGLRIERADLIIVGGGLLGCFTAFLAQRSGLSCILVEKSLPGKLEGRSSQAVSPLGLGSTPISGAALKKLSFATYRSLEQEMGLSLMAPVEQWLIAPPQSAQWNATIAHLNDGNLPYRLLTPPEIASRLPQLSPGIGIEGGGNAAIEVFAAVESTYDWLGVDMRALLWDRLQKIGVKCFAETEVVRVDAEYDQPTVLGRDLAFRGKFLAMTAAYDLLPALPPVLETRTQYLHRFVSPPPRGNFPVLPHFNVLFSNNSMHFEAARDHLSFTLGRRQQGLIPAQTTAELEEKAATAFRERWLPSVRAVKVDPPIEETREGEQARDGLPVISPHPWREDVALTAALGLDYTWLAPAAAQLIIDGFKGLAPERTFDLSRESLKENHAANSGP